MVTQAEVDSSCQKEASSEFRQYWRRLKCRSGMAEHVKDFTVVVGQREFRTSRSCLEKHSDFFKAMFSSGMKESVTGSVKIQDIGEDIMGEIVRFCEEDVPIPVTTRGHTISVFEAASLLQMADVRNLAEQLLIDETSLENVLDTFRIALFASAVQLQDQCGKLVCWHLSSLVEKLTPDHYDIVRYILRRDFSCWDENLVFRAVMAVIPGCGAQKAQELLDLVYLDNVPVPSDALRLYRTAEAGPRGYRKDSSTVAVAFESQDLCVFDRRLNKFRPTTQVPLKLVGYGLAMHERHLYLIGGEVRIGYGQWNKAIYRYDFLDSSWEHYADMQECRRSFSTCVSGDRIYILGGYGKYRTSMRNQVSVFHIGTRTWISRHRLSNDDNPDFNSSVCCRDGFFYLQDKDFRRIHEWSLRDEVLRMPNLPTSALRYIFPCGRQLLLSTFDSHLFLCDVNSKSIQEVHEKNPPEKEHDFYFCSMVDQTFFSIESDKIVQFEIDVEALTFTMVGTHRYVEDLGYEYSNLVHATCRVPFF